MCTSSHSYLQFERTFILSSSPCLILKPWGGYYHHHHGKRIFLPFGKLGRLLYYHKPKLLGSFFPKESTSYVISIKASFSLSKIIISKKLDQRTFSNAKNYNFFWGKTPLTSCKPLWISNVVEFETRIVILALNSTLHSGASVEIQRAILILHLSDFPPPFLVLSFEVWGTKGNETPHCSLKYYCFIQKHNLESTFPTVATFRNVFTQPFCIAKKGESNVITMFSRWTKRFIRDVINQKSG